MRIIIALFLNSKVVQLEVKETVLTKQHSQIEVTTYFINEIICLLLFKAFQITQFLMKKNINFLLRSHNQTEDFNFLL